MDKKGNKVDSVTAVTEATDDPTPDPSAATAAIPAANAGIENVGVKPDNRSLSLVFLSFSPLFLIGLPMGCLGPP